MNRGNIERHTDKDTCTCTDADQNLPSKSTNHQHNTYSISTLTFSHPITNNTIQTSIQQQQISSIGHAHQGLWSLEGKVLQPHVVTVQDRHPRLHITRPRGQDRDLRSNHQQQIRLQPRVGSYFLAAPRLSIHGTKPLWRHQIGLEPHQDRNRPWSQLVRYSHFQPRGRRNSPRGSYLG